MISVSCVFFFFFSSRRRHTRLTCDWSSDVCSSDLVRRCAGAMPAQCQRRRAGCQRSSVRDSSVEATRMHEPLEIRVLGPFEVLAGGTPADVGGSKRQALLVMLALRDGRPVDVDTLVDGLWGEELPAAPRNALHHHIA